MFNCNACKKFLGTFINLFGSCICDKCYHFLHMYSEMYAAFEYDYFILQLLCLYKGYFYTPICVSFY